MRKINMRGLFLFTVLLALSNTAMAGLGKKVIVNDSIDQIRGGNDNQCSLREAISWANGNRNIAFSGCTPTDTNDDQHPAGWGTIELQINGPYNFALGSDAVGDTHNNKRGDLDISKGKLIIIGIPPAGGKTVINANRLDRIFEMNLNDPQANDVTLQNLEITGGQSLDLHLDEFHELDSGGGILSSGAKLQLMDVVVRDNQSSPMSEGGGGIMALQTGADSLTITNSHITNNHGCKGSGGIVTFTPLQMTNTVLENNVGTKGAALGIYGSAVANTIVDSTFNNNHIEIDPGCQGRIGGSGGAINADSQVEVSINRSRFTSNTASLGGALYSLGGSFSVNSSTIENNTADSGGGIYIASSLDDNGQLLHQGTCVINSSTLHNNQATGNLGNGGGIYNLGALLQFQSATFSANHSNHDGGAVYNAQIGPNGASTAAQTTAFISTISGNTASNAGGGIFNSNDSTSALIASTLANNTSQAGAGGIHTDGMGAQPGLDNVIFYQSLLINNTNPNSGNPGGQANCEGGIVRSAGYNVAGFPCAPQHDDRDPPDVPVGRTVLANLAANGGPTQTHAFVNADDPAIDAIPFDKCFKFFGGASILTDQRGYCRPAGNGCDIGAFEAPVGGLDRGCAVGNNSDDMDLDTIPNALDNCPEVANLDQANDDHDGEGNVCEPPAPQPVPPEANCANLIDDDADGTIDCGDNDCIADLACQGVGGGGAPVVNEANCADLIDDDADGTVDCADVDCNADPVCQVAGVAPVPVGVNNLPPAAGNQGSGGGGCSLQKSDTSINFSEIVFGLMLAGFFGIGLRRARLQQKPIQDQTRI